MKFTILKDSLEEKLLQATRFTLSKISSVPLLQGARLIIGDEGFEIVATNLSDFFCTTIKTTVKERVDVIVDIKKVVEFLTFLPSGKIEVEFSSNQMIIHSDKTHASFSAASSADFPQIPKIDGKKNLISKNFLAKVAPLVLFAAAEDEARPILTGVYFKREDDISYVVATDGFRLSLITEKEKTLPSIIVPAKTLQDIIKLAAPVEFIEVTISEQEKLMKFSLGDIVIYSRMIEGEFPPFQRVIPKDYKTKITLERDEFSRNIKLAAVFAKDLSNIVVFFLKKDGLYIKPKTRGTEDTEIYQQAILEGEEGLIAFNYRFILDFLNNTTSKKIIFEMGEKNAPGVFRASGVDNFIHVVMPVRTDEETV